MLEVLSLVCFCQPISWFFPLFTTPTPEPGVPSTIAPSDRVSQCPCSPNSRVSRIKTDPTLQWEGFATESAQLWLNSSIFGAQCYTADVLGLYRQIRVDLRSVLKDNLKALHVNSRENYRMRAACGPNLHPGLFPGGHWKQTRSTRGSRRSTQATYNKARCAPERPPPAYNNGTSG